MVDVPEPVCQSILAFACMLRGHFPLPLDEGRLRTAFNFFPLLSLLPAKRSRVVLHWQKSGSSAVHVLQPGNGRLSRICSTVSFGFFSAASICPALHQSAAHFCQARVAQLPEAAVALMASLRSQDRKRVPQWPFRRTRRHEALAGPGCAAASKTGPGLGAGVKVGVPL